MKKIWLVLILCMTLAATAAGCSGNAGSGGADDAQNTDADAGADSSGSAGENSADAGSGDAGNGSADNGNDGEDAGGETEEKVAAVDFEVTLVSGETVKLSDYLGKKVLVNFWATWCGPCVQEMPAFQKLSENYPEDVVILAVNCGETEEDVKDFVEDKGYTFPIAIDENLEACSLYPTSSIPLTLIVDEEGYVTYASYGASDADTMYEHYKNELGLE